MIFQQTNFRSIPITSGNFTSVKRMMVFKTSSTLFGTRWEAATQNWKRNDRPQNVFQSIDAARSSHSGRPVAFLQAWMFSFLISEQIRLLTSHQFGLRQSEICDPFSISNAQDGMPTSHPAELSSVVWNSAPAERQQSSPSECHSLAINPLLFLLLSSTVLSERDPLEFAKHLSKPRSLMRNEGLQSIFNEPKLSLFPFELCSVVREITGGGES